MSDRDVVVTGLGAVSPMGMGVAALWDGLVAGRCVARVLTELPLAPEQSRIGVPVSDDVRRLAATRHALHDPVVAYALLAAQEAISQARLGRDQLQSAAVIVGTAVGGVISMEREFRKALQPAQPTAQGMCELLLGRVPPTLYRQFNAFSVSQVLAECTATKGFVTTVATGCTAGLDAIGLAMDLIATGECELAITGASEAPLTPIVITAFDNIGALSMRNDDPLAASRPFSRGRDGFVIGEGAGILVLESRRHAEARGASPICRLDGFSSRSNAFHMTSLHPSGSDLAWCMNDALQRAGIRPDAVGYVNAHGTSTPQNDVAEAQAIRTVFGEAYPGIGVSSSKSMLGHALGAASALAVCATVRSLETQLLHPTANLDPDPECDLHHLPVASRAASPLRYALCNASGFSGIHSSLVLSGFQPP